MNAPLLTTPDRTAPIDANEERDWLNWLAWLDTPAGQRWMEAQLDRLNPPLLSKWDEPEFLVNL